MDGYKWAKLPKPDNSEIREGDIREVTLPVRCAFIWSDSIPDEFDEEGNIIGYTSGWIMNIIDTERIYRDEKTRFLYQAAKNQNPGA